MVARLATRPLASATRAAGSNVVRARNCHLCHSVKDWKENHGAWSKVPTQSSLLNTSRTVMRSSPQARAYAATASGKSIADEKIEEITEAFNTAKDEFELAWEETEKKTTYAEGDREAAYEELKNTLALFEDAVSNSPQDVGREVQERVGHRIRELQAGFKRLDELVQEGD